MSYGRSVTVGPSRSTHEGRQQRVATARLKALARGQRRVPVVTVAARHEVALPADTRLEIGVMLVADRIRSREYRGEGRAKGRDAAGAGGRLVQQTAYFHEGRTGLVLVCVLAEERAETGTDQPPAARLGGEVDMPELGRCDSPLSRRPLVRRPRPKSCHESPPVSRTMWYLSRMLCPSPGPGQPGGR